MHEAHLDAVRAYYGDKVRQHGATAAGVDWRDAASQHLRFDRLLTLLERPGDSVLDVGCGWGALLPVLRARGFSGAYHGVDASADMIARARQEHRDADARFTCTPLAALDETHAADWVLASGIFNVKLDASRDAWESGVLRSLDSMHALARRGYAFNCLTAYSDTDRMADRLYYADPLFHFDRCKREHAPHVTLLHDYGLYEFTLLVRRQPAGAPA
jgi:SAM-dependent methyltransferase